MERTVYFVFETVEDARAGRGHKVDFYPATPQTTDAMLDAGAAVIRANPDAHPRLLAAAVHKAMRP